MENIAIIFGGESTEHDISIISALQAGENLNKQKYNITYIYISKKGEWFSGKELSNINFFKNFNEKMLKKVCIVPMDNRLYVKKIGGYKPITKIDCALLILHGKNGEDGTMQGLLELAKIPYTSPNVLGSSLGMDKIIMKQFFKANNLKVLPYYSFSKSEYFSNYEEILNNNEFDFPKIVKPCSLGSSIGINLCENVEELENAIDIAFQFDERVVVEKALTDFKEINISCLKNKEDIMLSDVEQPKNWKKFLDFEEKYLADNNSKAPQQTETVKISNKSLKIIKSAASKIYKKLNLTGVVRLDFMIDDNTNLIYINEINTIPGSLSFYLWKNNGYTFEKLLDLLISQAKYEFQKKQQIKTIYISDVLNKPVNTSQKTGNKI